MKPHILSETEDSNNLIGLGYAFHFLNIRPILIQCRILASRPSREDMVLLCYCFTLAVSLSFVVLCIYYILLF